MDLDLTTDEKRLIEDLSALKRSSGSHSPSIFTLLKEFPELRMKVDACFLSNPYATDLFEEYLNRDVLKTGRLREILEFYPSQNRALASILAPSIGISKEQLFVSNGAIEVIQALLHRWSKKVLVPLPTFSPYYEFALNSTEVVYYRLSKMDDYELNVDNIVEAVQMERPDTVVIINPNNPTGSYIKKSDLLSLIERISFVETIIIDESFLPFAYEDNLEQLSFSDLVRIYSNVVVIKSMSKDFGIAGIRLGFAVMNSDRVDILLESGHLWNLNGLAEYFIGLLSNEKFRSEYEPIRKRYLVETQDFFQRLSKIDRLKVIRSKANFALVELPPGYSAEVITAILLIRYGIYVRNCDDKVGLDGSYIRVASRSIDENKEIVKALEELFCA